MNDMEKIKYCTECGKQLNTNNATTNYYDGFCDECIIKIRRIYKKRNKGLYFIQMVELYKPSHIKIGISKDIDRRLKQLQTGNPYKLQLALVIEYKDMTEAKMMEDYLHLLFAKQRMEGEWFEDIDKCIKLLKITHELKSNGFDSNNVITGVGKT